MASMPLAARSVIWSCMSAECQLAGLYCYHSIRTPELTFNRCDDNGQAILEYESGKLETEAMKVSIHSVHSATYRYV
jgi:hypothetical protein